MRFNTTQLNFKISKLLDNCLHISNQTSLSQFIQANISDFVNSSVIYALRFDYYKFEFSTLFAKDHDNLYKEQIIAILNSKIKENSEDRKEIEIIEIDAKNKKSLVVFYLLNDKMILGFLAFIIEQSEINDENFELANMFSKVTANAIEKIRLIEEKDFVSKELEDRYIERAELLNVADARLNETLESKISLREKDIEYKAILKSITNNIDFYIWAIDKNFNLLFINENYKRSIFRNFNIEVNEGDNMFKYLPIQNFEKYRDFINKAFDGNKITFEEVKAYGDQNKLFQVTFFPILVEEFNETLGLICFIQDITEEKNSLSEMSQELQKERYLNKYQNKYISMISHEYKTPLTTIATSTYILERMFSANPDAKVEKQLKSINKSVDKINNLLNQALNISKVDNNKMCFIQKETNVRDHFEDILFGFSDEERRRIRFEYNGDNIKIIFASIALTIIADNLISNALKFSEKDVWVKITKTSNHIYINVKDSGNGISNEDLQFVFEPFYRGKSSIGIEGIGLGLSIVREIVESFNGEIDLKSVAGYGAEIEVKLPIEQN